MECHKPKPILLATGEMKFPFMWQPQIVPLQLISIGNFNTNPSSTSRRGALVIAALPGEFTTMSGRRLRNRITKVINEGFNPSRSSAITNQQVAGSNNLVSTNSNEVRPPQPDSISPQTQLISQGNDYSVIRQKRYLHLYRFLPMNRMQSFSDRMHSLSDSYLLQNQPLQVNDKIPDQMQNNPPEPTEQSISDMVDKNIEDEQLNRTLEDANYVRESTIGLNSDGYLNSNRIILSGLSNTYSSYITTFEEVNPFELQI